MCLLNCARNYLTIIFFIFCFIKISNTLLFDGVSLNQDDSCKFPLNSGEVIDLSPLLNSKQSFIVSTNTSLYTYQPCKDVPLNTEIVSDCQKRYTLCYFIPKNPINKPIDFNKILQNQTIGNFILLAHNNEKVFRENRMHQLEIVYKHANGDLIVTSIVRLECDEKIENYKLSIDKTSAQEHLLTLSSKYICLPTPHYMSGGTVFFIILIVFIALYFIGGVLVLKFIRGATGIEMIPNHEFWCNLPQLAKDGFKYFTSCGKSRPDSYEKI